MVIKLFRTFYSIIGYFYFLGYFYNENVINYFEYGCALGYG